MIKPDGYQNMGKILDKVVSEEGFEVTRLKMIKMDTMLARHFAQMCGAGDTKTYKNVMEELIKDVSIGVEINGNDVAGIINAMAGPANPKTAKEVAPNSFRAIYGTDLVQNAVYCTPDEDSTDADKFFKSGYTEVLDN